LETINDATNHYDQALSQMVLEQWIFTEVSQWVTVDGGLSRIVNGMVKSIRTPVQYSKRVTSITRESPTALNVSTNSSVHTFNHVINSAPLGAIQAMNLESLDLDYGKKLAIRKLNYDPAGKIGMKFKTRWWEKLPKPFKGGQSFSDLPIRRCVYPSYGVNTTDAAGTMIASYVSLV
jgi:monoamine oxidase